MNLYILTESDGSPIADKTAAAVKSTTDATAVESLGNVVLGDSEPLVVKFTTGTSAPAFAGANDYSLAVSLGRTTPNGSENYVETTTFSTVTGGWSGRLSLTGDELISAVEVAGGTSRCGGAPVRGGEFTLQIRVTNPSAQVVTYAMLTVFVAWRVL
jgi:hypothetical protein